MRFFKFWIALSYFNKINYFLIIPLALFNKSMICLLWFLSKILIKIISLILWKSLNKRVSKLIFLLKSFFILIDLFLRELNIVCISSLWWIEVVLIISYNSSLILIRIFIYNIFLILFICFDFSFILHFLIIWL